MNTRLKRHLLHACLLLCCLASPLPGLAASEEMTLNFVGADIESAVKAIGQITGRNFVIDPRVKGTINIVSGKPVSRDLAYQVLVSALRMQGYSVVEGGAVTKILPDADARLHAGPVGGRGLGDQITTQVFHIRYESAPQVLNALKPLVGPNQSITANAGSNTLVVTDAADNLRRIERIIASIDVPHGDDPQVIRLKHASAIEVAANIGRLFGNGAAGTAGSLVATADPRGNRIILRADNPGLLARAAALASEMDQPDAGFGNIRVVYLKHAEAPRIAQMLRAILGSETGSSNAAGQNTRLTGSTQSGGSSTSTGNNALSTQNAATGSNAGSNWANESGSSQNGAALVPGSMVQADVASNSLIITAPEPVFNNLQNVIAMLDRRRAQVHIEALIVELSAERAAEFGIQWQDLSGLGKTGLSTIGGTNFGGTGQNIITASTSISTLGTGLNLGITNGKITIPGVGTIANLGFLARVLESEAHANILSTPNIMTLDNEEAKIVIGKNLPFVTGSYSTTSTTSTVTPFQTYERRDVGLTLKVKPQITEGGVVRIQIYQEASSVQSGTASNTTGPITNTRSIESSVLVDDGKIIVLGGLIEDSFGANEEKVPLLGDIPFLRNFFRYADRSRKKTNLMVFLRPRIVRDELAYKDMTEDRYQQLLDGQKRQGEKQIPSWGEAGVPELPALPAAN